MATTSATPAPKANKVESFFTKFGDVLKDIFNAGANALQETEPSVVKVLPPALQAGYIKLVNAAVAQVAQADAKYAQIGASDVPFAVKVAEAVAVGGDGVLAIAAQEGLVITTDLPTFFTAATQIAQSLNLATITEAPTPAAASTTAA